VIDGLEADVVTLALAFDVDALNRTGKADPGQLADAPAEQQRPVHLDDRVPRSQGQPKGIKDWDDLARPGISVITPNPKTSGGARWKPPRRLGLPR